MPRLSFALEITLGSSLIVGERRVDLNEKTDVDDSSPIGRKSIEPTLVFVPIAFKYRYK